MPSWAPPYILIFLFMTSAVMSSVQAADPAAKCAVDLQVLEKSDQFLSIKLRNACGLGKPQVQSALAGLRRDAFAQGGAPRMLRTYLGRAVDYPWVSLAMGKAALNSKEWDSVAGKTRRRAINSYVAALLGVSGALDDLLPGWSLQSISVEKVLVQPATKIAGLATSPKDKSLLPYDAMLWLTWAPLPSSSLPAADGQPAVNPPARLEE